MLTIKKFLSIADLIPEHLAVVESGTRSTDYSSLRSLAFRIAASIPQLQDRQTRVLIHLEQSAYAYAAMFGALLAGAVYCPVNLGLPTAKRQSILELFSPDIVIGGAECLKIGSQKHLIESPETEPTSSEELPDVPSWKKSAYVIFTSGSTGDPKGVEISRNALDHYVAWIGEFVAPTHMDRWSQHPSIGFDLSVMDIFGSLCYGATLYPVTQNTDRLMPSGFIKKHRLTIWNSVPSVVDQMSATRQVSHEYLTSLRLMSFCGEPLFPHHLESIFNAHPDLVVHQTYGPTEATVSMTLLALRKDNWRNHVADRTVSLGHAIPGMGLWLVKDGQLNTIEGEIVLTGPQLATGYWRDPARSELVFRDILFPNGTSQPAYWTGDWGKMFGNDLYFQARTDRQVKIHGYRLELDEIDAALRSVLRCPSVTVFVRERLMSYIEVEPSLLNVSSLILKLREILPLYAIPTYFQALVPLPRTSSDKIDVQAINQIARSLGSL
ncbi:MAG: AMP-binding protein [Nitrospirae bacterium]|nr:AMP-binding protein [Magnetococcales bacterium]